MTKQALKSKVVTTLDVGRFLQDVRKRIADEDWDKLEELSKTTIETTPNCGEAWFASAIAAFHKNDLAAAAAQAEQAQ